MEKLQKREQGELAVVEGLVERCLYHDAKTSFAIYLLRGSADAGQVKIVGPLGGALRGQQLVCHGRWQDRGDYGRQLRVVHWQSKIPESGGAMAAFLAGGLFPGIGPKRAARLIELFGERLPTVLDETPQALLQVAGIGKKKLQQILAAWNGLRGNVALQGSLVAAGLGRQSIAKIFRLYPGLTLVQLASDPFRILCRIRGISFAKADRVAKQLGIEREAPARIAAGLEFLLSAAEGEGHLFLPSSELLKRGTDLLQLPRALVADGLAAELQQPEQLVSEQKTGAEPAVYLKQTRDCERALAADLLRLQGTASALPQIQSARALVWASKRLGLVLSEEQAQAFSLCWQKKICLISGGPGTGKTTIVRTLAAVLQQKEVAFELCAPTGRAAKRMAELSGQPAKTIHRLLEYSPGGERFAFHRKNPLAAAMVIVDETSMVDLFLMGSLLAALPSTCHLVLIGDEAQLPSVGPGTVLADIINSGRFSVQQLNHVYRQKEGSLIRVNAHHVRQGKMPVLRRYERAGGSDFIWQPVEHADQYRVHLRKYLIDVLAKQRGFDLAADIQVLTPVNRGPLGTIELNRFLQTNLNPQPEASQHPSGFHPGDKVIQLRNNYDLAVFNGEIGQVLQLESAGLQVAMAERTVFYSTGDVDDLALAYAISIHKAQGSEYPAVIVLLPEGFSMFLQRNIFYTALTRAKKTVVVLSSLKAIKDCLANDKVQERYSLLARRLIRQQGEIFTAPG